MKLEQKLSDENYLKHDEFIRTSKMYMLSRIPGCSSLRILDIGCGTGLNASYIAKCGHEVVGCDISFVALSKYHKRFDNALQCDLTHGVPLKNESFDLVFASEVIEHLYDIPFFLSESYRVMKSGGILLLSTPNSAFWLYRLLAVFGRTLSELQHPGHIRFFSKPTLIGIIKEAGFELMEVSGRHMYVLINDAIGNILKPVLIKFGFTREYRLRTGTFFWHKSRFRQCGGNFWSDTLIVKALKK